MQLTNASTVSAKPGKCSRWLWCANRLGYFIGLGGDLTEVTTEVTFGNGATSSQTSSISGSSASGTHELQERGGQGEADVTLTVTDANGNQTTQTKTISLN